MSDDGDNTTFTLNLDADDFIAKANQAFQAISQIGENSESMAGLVAGLEEAGVAVGALAAAFYAGKEAFELIMDAEQIQQVSAEFDRLSNSAGVFADTLKTGLVDASKGWVDETTLMQAANQAMIGLETGVDKLPDLMKLAQQATQVMGGSVIDNFNAIARAVESGNTRQLKHLGIIVDQQKAYRDYATSIGVTVDSLSQAGKQQAVLNAVLDQGQTKFGQGNDSIMKYTTAWNQLKAELIEAKEQFTLLFYQAIDPVIAGVMKLASLWTGLQSKMNSVGLSIANYITGNKQAQASMGDLQKSENDLANAQKARAQVSKASSVDHVKAAQQEAQAKRELSSIDSQLIKEEMTNMDSVSEAERLYHAQLKQEADAVQAQIDQVKAKVQEGKLTQMQGTQEIERLNKLKNLKLIEDEAQLEQYREQALDKWVSDSNRADQAVARSFQATAIKNKYALHDMGAFGTATVSAFSSNAVSNIEAFGAGTKSATDAVEGMFAGMAGDMAENYGKMMMLASIWPPNPVAFAGGVALVALGGYLKSIGNSTSSSSGAVVGAGAGVGAPPVPVVVQGPDQSALSTASQTTPQKTVSINIEGNYYDNDQFRQALIQMIRNESDATDFNITKLGSG